MPQWLLKDLPCCAAACQHCQQGSSAARARPDGCCALQVALVTVSSIVPCHPASTHHPLNGPAQPWQPTPNVRSPRPCCMHCQHAPAPASGQAGLHDHARLKELHMLARSRVQP